MAKPVATLGDKHACPLHRNNAIVSGSGKLTVNGKPTACVGDSTGCGATIIEGAPVAMAGGQMVAFLGSKTSHGGTIVSGDSRLMLDTGMAQIVGGLDEGIAELLQKEDYTKTLHLKDAEGKPLSDTPYVLENAQGKTIASGTTDSSGHIRTLSSGDIEESYNILVGFDALDKLGEEA